MQGVTDFLYITKASIAEALFRNIELLEKFGL